MQGRQERMERSAVVLILAGGLRPAPLQQELGVPPLRLPLGREGTLLDWWIRTIHSAGRCREIRIVVNNDHDADFARRLVHRGNPPLLSVAIITEPASWRGAGGVLRDLSGDVSAGGFVVAVEASCLPPPSLEPVLDALADGATAVVGASSDNEPAGVYGFHRSVIEDIPAIGYYDLKEQLCPTLYKQGHAARLVRLADRVQRIRDRPAYLRAVQASLGDGANRDGRFRCSALARVSPEARIMGYSILEDEVVVHSGAVVHDSVVLAGAVVHRGAVVSRSIVGPGAKVARAQRLVGGILAATVGVGSAGGAATTTV